MRRTVLIVVVLAVVATGAVLWPDRDTRKLRNPDAAGKRDDAVDNQDFPVLEPEPGMTGVRIHVWTARRSARPGPVRCRRGGIGNGLIHA